MLLPHPHHPALQARDFPKERDPQQLPLTCDAGGRALVGPADVCGYGPKQRDERRRVLKINEALTEGYF